MEGHRCHVVRPYVLVGVNCIPNHPFPARLSLEMPLARLEWIEEEIEALARLVRLGRLDRETIVSVFPYRTIGGVRKKIRDLRDDNPDHWTPPPPNRGINWATIEVLEKECEKSQLSETCTQEVSSHCSPKNGLADGDL